ncbi:hypothetical protein [Limnoglobus roseus]|nr:hypothetical protein [Limnoglobus roseus]
MARERSNLIQPPEVGSERFRTSAAIETTLAGSLASAFDLSRWAGTSDGLEELLTRTQEAVTRSIEEEGKLRGTIRGRVLADLATFPDAPSTAGVYRVPDHLLRAARRNVLLPGHVTACDGVSASHDGLTGTVATIGICLVRYDGLLNTWRSTFLWHDYDTRAADPVGHLRGVLSKRSKRSTDELATDDAITVLLRRGLMAAAERKALLDRGTTRWRMGHGVPAPLELLTGGGSVPMVDAALPLLEELLLKETRWVFLPATMGNRALLTLANALSPGELAIFQKGKPMVEAVIDLGNYAPGYRRKVEAFATRLGEATVVGGYRATRYAPPQLFVAHAERAVEAGIVAMADGGLQPHRGYPLLLELADLGAKTGLGINVFGSVVETAYARAKASHLCAEGRVT